MIVNPIMRLIVLIAGLYALGALTLLVAGWMTKWPHLKAQLIQLGNAACTFALGFTGLLVVWLVLRSLGVLGPRQ